LIVVVLRGSAATTTKKETRNQKAMEQELGLSFPLQ
jgi:hypothetical protein